MDLNSPDAWRWIWLVTAAAFSVAEVVTPQAFFFLPFAVGALLGAALAFAGVALALEWLAFVVATAGAYAVLWPIGRRLARGGPTHAIGANRWVGREAVVLADIPAELGGTGTVRLDREQWRAESGARVAIPAGSTVLVTRVDGTRLVVLPLDIAPPTPIDKGAE
jgi:membrane protein implicated in regulation of membrane protease activity